MDIQLLSEDYIEKNGATYDDLHFNIYTDEFLDADEEDVSFYDNGNIKNYQIMANGTIKGEKKEWYPDGNKKRFAVYKHGRCLSYQEWDEKGQLIAERKKPTNN